MQPVYLQGCGALISLQVIDKSRFIDTDAQIGAFSGDIVCFRVLCSETSFLYVWKMHDSTCLLMDSYFMTCFTAAANLNGATVDSYSSLCPLHPPVFSPSSFPKRHSTEETVTLLPYKCFFFFPSSSVFLLSSISNEGWQVDQSWLAHLNFYSG